MPPIPIHNRKVTLQTVSHNDLVPQQAPDLLHHGVKALRLGEVLRSYACDLGVVVGDLLSHSHERVKQGAAIAVNQTDPGKASVKREVKMVLK